MHRAFCTDEYKPRRAAVPCRLVLAVSLLVIAGCAAPPKTPNPRPAFAADAVVYESKDIRIRLVGLRRQGDEGTLVEDPGWLEYVLAVENSGRQTLTVHNVKLLSSDGRYLDSAGSYGQVTSPPDAATQIAGSAATKAAGIAAGQVVPFGGTVVGILAGAASATATESRANAIREFERRKIKAVELAPAGRMTGSAYLPLVANAKALVLDYGHEGASKRVEIPLQRR